jgi:hypothetical protein
VAAGQPQSVRPRGRRYGYSPAWILLGGTAVEVVIQERLDRVTRWASERADIRALALVGSHASNRARPDSDINLVLFMRCVRRAG